MACRETLFQGTEPLSPTPPNVRYAHRVAEEIRRQLRAGTFTDETYAEFFPQSKRARGHSPSALTFGKLCDLWIESKGSLEDAACTAASGSSP